MRVEAIQAFHPVALLSRTGMSIVFSMDNSSADIQVQSQNQQKL